MKKFLFLITVAALLWACGKKDTKPARPRDYIKKLEGVHSLKGTYKEFYIYPGRPDSEVSGEFIDTVEIHITNDTELVMTSSFIETMYFKYRAGNEDSAERIYFRGSSKDLGYNYSNFSSMYYYYKKDSLVDTNRLISLGFQRYLYLHSM